MAPSLRQATTLLKGEKIKERQEGLALIKEIFSDERNLEALDPKGDGKSWLATFQSLFNTVIIEKTTCTKKGSWTDAQPVALGRLRESAAMVRWLAERAVPYLNRKVVRALFAHLVQMLDHRGELFEPVALDYIKSLRALFSHPPHLDHLDTDQWLTVVGTCFNIVLGDRLDRSLDAEDDSGNDGHGRPLAAHDTDDEDMVSNPRFRRQLRLEDIELMSCLEVVVNSSSAPLVSQEKFGRHILNRYLRFFEAFSSESSAHLSALVGFSRVLSELELNERMPMTQLGLRAWQHLLDLWSTKSRMLKEQVVIALRVLFPFVAATGSEVRVLRAARASPDAAADMVAKCTSLHRLLQSEPDSRWSLEILPLSSIELVWSERETTTQLPAFHCRSFGPGRVFSSNHALTWAALELDADLLSCLPKMSENALRPAPAPTPSGIGTAATADNEFGTPFPSTPSHTPMPSTQPLTQRAAKRRRLDNTQASNLETSDLLSMLLLGLPLQAGQQVLSASPARTWKLQTLLFLIERHGSNFDSDRYRRILQVLVDLLADEDAFVQSWAFICLAALALKERFQDATSRSAAAKLWTQAWNLACRRTSSSPTCRAASHAANAILRLNLISVEVALPDIQGLLTDLDMQGPSFPYDSVCGFFVTALERASGDVNLSRSRLEDRVAGWLQNRWSPIDGTTKGFNSRSHLEAHDPVDVLQLMSRICHHRSPPPAIRSSALLPTCAIVTRIVEESESHVIRNFLLHAKLPSSSQSELGTRPIVDGSSGLGLDVATTAMQPNERRCSALLEKAVGDFTEEWEAAEHPPGSVGLIETCTAEQVRRTLDLLALVFLFEGTLAINHVRSSRTLMAMASKLLGVIAPILSQKRWSSSDCAVMLKGLEPLLKHGGLTIRRSVGHDRSYWPALINADSQSGIRSEFLVSVRGQPSGDNTEAYKFLHRVWHAADVQDTLDTILRSLRGALRAVTGMSEISDEVDEMDDDDFGEVRRARNDSNPGLIQAPNEACAERSAAAAAIDVCVAGLVEIPRLRSGVTEAHRDSGIVDMFLNGALSGVQDLGDTAFGAVARSRLHLSLRDADAILERFGSEMLPSYDHARNEKAHLTVVSFLESTMHMWLDPNAAKSDFVQKVRQLCTWLTGQMGKKKSRLSWRVRLSVAAFLQRYLSHDPSQAFWTFDEDNMSTHLPSGYLELLGSDDDMRVRFAVATQAAWLFQVLPAEDVTPDILYNEIRSHLTEDVAQYERMVSRVLCLGNVMIASSAVRRSPFFHLLEVAVFTRDYDNHIYAVLEAVSERLGFDSLREMYAVFAGQVTFGLLQAGYDPLKVPINLLGFTSRKQYAECTFKTAGSMMLAVGTPAGLTHFETLVKLARKTVKEGMQECLPFLAASEIAFAFEDSEGAQGDRHEVSWKQATQALTTRFALREGAAAAAQAVRDIADQIVSVLLSMMHEVDCSAASPFVQTLDSLDSGTAQVFKLLSTSQQNAQTLHEPNKPFFSGLTIYHSMRILATGNIDIRGVETTYHVLHQMLSLIYRNRIVNDQLRHLQALGLFVAMCRQAFLASNVLLRTLLHGVTVLLGQLNLVDPACRLLEWALDTITEHNRPPLGLRAIIVTIAMRADRYCRQDSSPAQATGERIFGWIEVVLQRLVRSESSRGAVADALYAWPRALGQELNSLLPSPTLELLTGTLARLPRGVDSSHILMRFRQVLSEANRSQVQSFASSTFWQLLQTIGPHAVPRQGKSDMTSRAAVAQAIADILQSCEGRLRSPEIKTIEGLASSEADYALSSVADEGDATAPLKGFIALKVLSLLQNDALDQAEEAFHRMRAIVYLHPNFAASLQRWPEGISEELRLLAAYVTPPFRRPARTVDDLIPMEQVKKANDFNKWVCYLSKLLGDLLSQLDPFYGQVSSLAETNTSLARDIFPVLLHAVLLLERTVGQGDDARLVISGYLSKVLESGESDHQSWSAIVNCVLYLRRYSPPHADSPLDSDRWLELDNLLLARRALQCKLYTTALMFVELAGDYQPEEVEQQQSMISTLLYDVYSNVEDPDGFYGIVNPDLRGSLVQRLHHEGEWQRAFELHAADFESMATTTSSIVQSGAAAHQAGEVDVSLHAMGFHRLASVLGQPQRSAKRGHEATKNEDISYDLAWRTGAWDLPSDEKHVPGTGRSVFAALRALHRERDPARADEQISLALATELSGLHELGIEATAGVRRVGRDLLSLREIRRWREAVSTYGADQALVRVKLEWSNVAESFDFDDFERILSIRRSLLRSERQREQADQMGDLLSPFTEAAIELEQTLLLSLSRGARRHDKLQASVNAVTIAQHLESELDSSDAVAEEFASVLWMQGEHAIAIQALNDVLARRARGGSQGNSAHSASVLARLGQWSATARAQQPTEIDRHYFAPAYELLGEEDIDPSQAATVYYQYAVFADEQYRRLASAPEFYRLQLYVDRKKEELRQNQSEMARTNSQTQRNQLYMHKKTAERILAQDMAQLRQFETSQATFLERATTMYARALATSDDHDDATVRLTSLWFENASNDSLNKKMAPLLQAIPSRKFVFLTHQLSARLSRTNGSGASPPTFQTNLGALMLRLCTDHPFHTLYAVFALRNATPNGSSKTARGRASSTGSSQQMRALAADELFARVRQNPRLKERIVAFEQVCVAYVEWAELDLAVYPHYFRGNQIKKGHQKMPPASDLKICRMKNVNVPVATAETPIDPTCTYDNIVSIAKYGDTFTTAGGLHLPKIVDCLGSDGRKYKQLFKKEDDLRQDAVMQQVFRLVNKLLSQDRRARDRQLTVRTYLVLPLGPQCGLLEFVGNTLPIGEVLTRMHDVYRPNDIRHFEARAMIRDAAALPAHEKLEVFHSACEQFQPAFRHFFLETHKLPPAWFGMRLNYTRSASTTSIVGHVLGLGDRHVSNILIDKGSGELVHIDFGVAFDQGKLLPIPELVPFRLTRDLVDGMGMSGVEGVFRRCCEETLRVLREGADVVKTVLEVFKFDPLFTWTSNPIKVLKAQGGGEDDFSNMNMRLNGDPSTSTTGQDTAELSADRALSSVTSKLSSTLSVEYTVNELIQQATDAGNLSMIFHGWQACL